MGSGKHTTTTRAPNMADQIKKTYSWFSKIKSIFRKKDKTKNEHHSESDHKRQSNKGKGGKEKEIEDSDPSSEAIKKYTKDIPNNEPEDVKSTEDSDLVFSVVEIDDESNSEKENNQDDDSLDRVLRLNSADSGYKTDEKDDLTKKLSELSIDKKNKKHVKISRGPIKTPRRDVNVDPYARQVHINQQALAGGHIVSTKNFVEDSAIQEELFSAIDIENLFIDAQELIEKDDTNSQQISNPDLVEILNGLYDTSSPLLYNQEQWQTNTMNDQTVEYGDYARLYGSTVLSPQSFGEQSPSYDGQSNHYQNMTLEMSPQTSPLQYTDFEIFQTISHVGDRSVVNVENAGIKDLYAEQQPNYYAPQPFVDNTDSISNLDGEFYQTIDPNLLTAHPSCIPSRFTPPIYSPESCSDPNNTFNTLSPATSSPVSYDEEISVSNLNPSPSENRKSKPRNNSTSTMKLPQYKELQKKICSEFESMECCLEKQPIKNLFGARRKKLTDDEFKFIVLNVVKMSIVDAFGTLLKLTLSLSRSPEHEDVHYIIFLLICGKMLDLQPDIFQKDMGLRMLIATSIRCPDHPLLTRYLVHCIRTTLKNAPTNYKRGYVFDEVDKNKNTLPIALSQLGDSHALVLSEILEKDPEEIPLFNINAQNNEGYTALHVCCAEHSSNKPRIHCIHVLLEHGKADLCAGDGKGGDTPLHLAVNKPDCCLRVIMLLFAKQDRKLWYDLAHMQNRSSVTPLEYARSYTRSASRENYPCEVHEFLKKCRKSDTTPKEK